VDKKNKQLPQKGQIMSQLLDEKHFALSTDELIHTVNDTRNHTLSLVADLSDFQMSPPYKEHINPFIWELGHIAFFYEAFLNQILDPSPSLIEGGNDLYNSFEIDHIDRWSLPLPSKKETLAYLDKVKTRAIEQLQKETPSAKTTYLTSLAVLHEDMHGEAFTYMRQTLEYNGPPDIGKPSFNTDAMEAGPHPGDAKIPGGVFQLGATPDLPFVFDNEKWAHPVEVAPFQIAKAPVTNTEFVQFIEDDGYHRRELWSTPGWIWRSKQGAQTPLYWAHGESERLRRHFHQWIPIKPHAPVIHITWHEAEAYCHWANRRLPTEAEWEMAASAKPNASGEGVTAKKCRYPWGDAPPTPHHANLDSRHQGCVDVAAYPEGDSAFGCRQMLGNVWEWTATPFYPFPGFVLDYPYREYSAPWFGDRKVLKGAAWATRSRLAYNTYRNFFPPDRNDVFAGFRTCAV